MQTANLQAILRGGGSKKNEPVLFGLLNKKTYFCTAICGFLERNHIANSPCTWFQTLRGPSPRHDHQASAR